MALQELMQEMQKYYELLAPRYESKKEAGVVTPQLIHFIDTQSVFHREQLSNRDVLEIACGPGTFTQSLAQAARSILAADGNESTLVEARKKTYPPGKVRFVCADAYTLEGIEGTFNGGFAMQWFSHIPKSKVHAFLDVFHARLTVGARVVLSDTLYSPPGPGQKAFLQIDEEGNNIQMRGIPGSPDPAKRYRVIKNHPSEQELRVYLAGRAIDVEYSELEGCWRVAYTVSAASR